MKPRSIGVFLVAWVLANHHVSIAMKNDYVGFQDCLLPSRNRRLLCREWTALHERKSASNTGAEHNNLAMSHISSIQCKNFAGIVGDGGGGDLNLQFDMPGSSISNNFVCVSGETGVGKSLLISKVVDLVTGGKASSSLLHNPTAGASTSVEIILKLCNSGHVNMVRQNLGRMNVDPRTVLPTDADNAEPVYLSLKRSLTFPSSPGKVRRLKSTCYINEQQVSLRILKGIGAPLLPVVNAPVASNALGRASSRMAMIDAGVSSDLQRRVRQLSKVYETRRCKRKLLEQELASRVLPKFKIGQEEKDAALLEHWVQELSGFEGRIMKMSRSVNTGMVDSNSDLVATLDEISKLDWMDNDSIKPGFSSALYRSLLELSDQLILVDEKVEASLKARESMGSLSSPDSALTAQERTRDLLVRIGEKSALGQSKVIAAAERAHDLLNQVEMALTEFVAFLDDDDSGLLAALQTERSACSISSESLGEYLLEWNTLARKHGVSPYLLPSCHAGMRQELYGNVESRTLLQEALSAENDAHADLVRECRVLSRARIKVAERLSDSVSRRLPSLGMDARFSVRVQEVATPLHSLGLGVDEIDFFLYHEDNGINSNEENKQYSAKRGGKVELVASTGERARILLAVECEIPGSIRALCGVLAPASDPKSVNSLPAADDDNDILTFTSHPVAVIYDEIDAHVGGRASVAVAQMLSEQSESCQVVSITHSASVAAMADIHICVQKFGSNGQTVVSATPVEGPGRLKELARMASGNMALEEAEAFAEALIRDAALSRQASLY